MLVTVTDAHVFSSLADDNAPCPIQMAIEEAFGVRVLVGPEEAVVGWGGDSPVRYRLPRAAKKFIRRFDSDASVTGIQFTLQEQANADDRTCPRTTATSEM